MSTPITTTEDERIAARSDEYDARYGDDDLAAAMNQALKGITMPTDLRPLVDRLRRISPSYVGALAGGAGKPGLDYDSGEIQHADGWLIVNRDDSSAYHVAIYSLDGWPDAEPLALVAVATTDAAVETVDHLLHLDRDGWADNAAAAIRLTAAAIARIPALGR